MTEFEEQLRRMVRGGWDPESIVGKNADAEFDRWLKKVKAQAYEEGLAEAFYVAGTFDPPMRPYGYPE